MIETETQTTQTTQTTTRAVLFDMGGVLVELGPLDELLGVDIEPERFWPLWLASPSVRRYERGECSADEFGRGLASELGLQITGDEVVERFGRFPRGLYPGAAELVRSVRSDVVTGVLSNTNAVHWEEQADAEVIQKLVDRLFLSFELGLVKPDDAIYQRVLDELHLEPAEVVFLDDNQLNVDRARSVGLDAHLARGVDQARHLLTERNLLA